MIRRILALAGLGACALALAGCISLLPKSTISQMYRFGSAPTATPGPQTGTVSIFRTNGEFQEEAADDRILTVTGGKAAYIAEARWVAPAQVLFDQAIFNAFDASPVRLLARGQQGRATYALRIDVRSFEANYDARGGAPPTIVVHVHAALTKSDQSNVGEEDFEARVPATDNRVGAIVTAFDKAVTDVVGKVVAWTETKAV
jgi:cholesterol transport system auxiliary component